MKESKKAILKALTKDGKKGNHFDMLVLNLALQKIDSDSFDFDGEAVYTDDRKHIVYCLSTKERFAIPDGVETIGEMAFRRKRNLKSVVIPPSVTTIGHDAFYDCDQLDNVCIPASVLTVGGFAFAECDGLRTVTFAGVPKHLSRHAFDDSDALHNIIVPENGAKVFQKALHYDPAEDDFLIIEKQ